MKTAKHAFTLVELAVAAAALSLVLSVLAAGVFRAKELSRRMVCSVNLRGIGAAAKVYATINADKWMVPPFQQERIGRGGIEYHPGQSPSHKPPQRGEVGYLRGHRSESESSNGVGGSSAVTTSRAFWLLVRSGDVTVEQFICPSALHDTADPTENIDLYYDFQAYENISYGYQVPFGPTPTQPREGSNPRRINAADQGPFYFSDFPPNWNVGRNAQTISLDDTPGSWQRFNSPNHGGQNQSEGQNVLFADGSVSFARIPAVGVDHDNIYTVMTDEWSTIVPAGKNRIHGYTPHIAPSPNPYPGEEALNTGINGFSSSDTLIFP